MKKICYITTISATIQSFFLETIEALSRNGFNVTIICGDELGSKNNLPENITFIQVDMRRGISFLSSMKAIISFYKVFRKEKFDLIQYSTPNASFYASIAGVLARIPNRVYHNMGFIYLSFEGFKRQIFLLIERITCALSSKVQFVSKSNLKHAVNTKIVEAKKAYIIWNGSSGGIDLRKFNCSNRIEYRNEIKSIYRLNDNDYIFGFVGRIVRDKGINELLGAFQRIERDDVKLLIVGPIEELDGIDQTLWKWATESDRVIFCGSQQDVAKYYSAMDVLVLPSYREGFGNVIIEAEAMGTPVIASNIPGPQDAMINERTGLFCQPRDETDLYEKMELALNNKELFTQYGNAAVEYVNNSFDSRILINKILKDKKDLLKCE